MTASPVFHHQQRKFPMTESSNALGTLARAEAMDVLRDYGALHAALQRLVELDQAGKAYADPAIAPDAKPLELYEHWRALNARMRAAFAELVRIDADLASRRRAVLGEPPPNQRENMH
jgi:hypothetical protein